MLRELHGFPVDRAATLLRLGRPETAWSDHYTDLWSTIATVALPEIRPELADEVSREYTNFVEILCMNQALTVKKPQRASLYSTMSYNITYIKIQ